MANTWDKQDFPIRQSGSELCGGNLEVPVCADETCRLACPGPNGHVFWPGRRIVLYEVEKML